MNKEKLSETDIKTKYITPAIKKAGWDIKEQLREEYSFTDGRIIVRKGLCRRGKKKKIDYLLFYKPNLPIAIIEAKNNKHSIGSGMQQGIAYSEGLKYAKQLDVPFVFSSNGDAFLEHDMATGIEKELTLDDFPSPEDLWKRFKKIASPNQIVNSFGGKQNYLNAIIELEHEIYASRSL